ncbi:hypothetical protein HO173_005529 [Letharia columbiana]|uniref:Xylanolytic transcriptional activator regulatory domain-containing protein n=1 Tax=Letharia columbiana TaxID=112416 RepID=A0A8H6FWV5_9LECA|nr:uncharacterized protein HO173_005529 [Letharia columbiana]KAF6236277.1 hypothetical protein HO173_005529 [Letharia columbiana]
MLTAGRCLRLVLMARLSDIDSPGPDRVNCPQASPVLINCESVRGDTFSILEEQRRVFWVSFCLDRCLCLRNEYPLTLQEDMICVRLPAPEANFQNNQSIRTTFLPEAISAPQNTPPLSSFAECILAVTLHGHCLALQRFPPFPDPITNPVDTNPPFWSQRKHLVLAVETRLRVLGTSHGSRPLDSDPMLLFAHIPTPLIPPTPGI